MTDIAVLYPGAMGRALADALAPSEHTLVSYVSERSQQTRENARSARVHVVPSFADLVDAAEIVVSVVPPGAALAVAERYAEGLRCSRRWKSERGTPLFVDANSIAPSTMTAIGQVIAAAGGRCVDGVFLGPSNPISRRTLLMLSGPDAPVAAEIFGAAVATRVAGDEIGHASAVKMGIALVTKALVALFIEMACAAEKAGCLDATLDVMRDLYGGTMEFLERNLPTYRRHAARRIGEMKEAQAWLTGMEQLGAMTEAATTVLERLRDSDLDVPAAEFDALVREIVALQPLTTAIPPASVARMPHVNSQSLHLD
jgi:3-hydroxyisobutyrate dehydrogenase-like beta-hydroxyacid dehydrogenase